MLLLKRATTVYRLPAGLARLMCFAIWLVISQLRGAARSSTKAKKCVVDHKLHNGGEKTLEDCGLDALGAVTGQVWGGVLYVVIRMAKPSSAV